MFHNTHNLKPDGLRNLPSFGRWSQRRLQGPTVLPQKMFQSCYGKCHLGSCSLPMSNKSSLFPYVSRCTSGNHCSSIYQLLRRNLGFICSIFKILPELSSMPQGSPNSCTFHNAMNRALSHPSVVLGLHLVSCLAHLSIRFLSPATSHTPTHFCQLEQDVVKLVASNTF